MDNFLPQNYEVPKSGGNYVRLIQGDNVIRILSNPIMGWLDWKDNKPVRTPYGKKPEPINPERPVKHFWAFIVWDYADKKIKIMEITQITIQETIKAFNEDIEWGSPLNYDINIKKTGEKMDTKYSVIARPPKLLNPEIEKLYKETRIDLNELYRGGDPFGSKTEPHNEEAQSGHIEDPFAQEDPEPINPERPVKHFWAFRGAIRPY